MEDFGLAVLFRYYVHTLTILGAAGLVICLGEKAFGFNIRGAIDAIEKRAQDGDVWPVTAVIVVGISALAYALK